MIANIQKKLELAMAEKGVTATELAEKTGLRRQSIYQLRKAKWHHPITIYKLAKALDLPVSFFLN